MILFLSLHSHADHADGVEYAFGIRTGSSLFHPHHVLYTAFGWVLHQALGHFIEIDPLTLLQLLSSLATALTVAVFFLLIMQITDSESISLLVTAFYAFNYSTLYMGTTAEVYPYSVLCELLALLLFLRTQRQSAASLFIVSMLAALAVLFHQSAIFFVFALVVFIALQTRSIWPAAFVALTSGALALAVYIYAATENEVQDVAGFWHWIFFYTHSEQYAAGTWGSGLAVSRILEILVGILTTVVKPDVHKYMIKQRLLTELTDFALVPAAALLGMAALLTVRWLWQYRKTLVTRQSLAKRPLRLLLLLWLLGGGLFVAWWDQTNIEFWYMLVAPALLLFALRLHTLTQQGGRLSPALFILAGSLLLVNLAGRVYADAQPSRSIAAGVISAIGCEHLENGDLIIGPIWDLPPAIRYQCEKNTETASIHQAAHEPTEKARALQRYAQALYAGRKHVYFLETELVPTVRKTYYGSDWQDDEVEAFYRPLLFGARPIGTFTLFGTPYTIYELQPQR